MIASAIRSRIESRWNARCRMRPQARRRPGSAVQVESLDQRVLMSADPVLRWNQVALDATVIDTGQATPSQGGPTRTSRALAMVHVAIYDAVNGILMTGTPYLVQNRAPRGASLEAAVASAAGGVLADLYPQQRATFEQALKADLDAVPDGPAERLGVMYGRVIAQRISQSRRNDGATDPMTWTVNPDPGHWSPDPLNPGQKGLTPAWGNVKPFAVASSTQFRSPPPPALDSPEYAAAFDEVKRLGAINSTERTADQTEIGLFWGYDGPQMGTPPRLYNQNVREIAQLMGNTVAQNARLFALVNLAMADAGITSWETKYYYDIWRPVTAIRRAAEDGNAATVADPAWIPLGAPGNGIVPDFTPPFPAYTSGHATFGAATFEMLANFYGTENVAFTLTSGEFDGVRRPFVTRSYTSFEQASQENGQSRIYLGIHWQFDNTAGQDMGNAIADYVFANSLRPSGGGYAPMTGGAAVIAMYRKMDFPHGLAEGQILGVVTTSPQQPAGVTTSHVKKKA